MWSSRHGRQGTWITYTSTILTPLREITLSRARDDALDGIPGATPRRLESNDTDLAPPVEGLLDDLSALEFA